MKKLSYLLKPQTISQKIISSIFIISSIVTLTVSAIQISYDYLQEIKILKKSLNLVENGYTKSLGTSLWELNDLQTQTLLDGIISIPGIEYASITYNNHVIAKAGSISTNNIQKTIELNHLDKNGEMTILGNLVVSASEDFVRNKIYNRIWVIFITQFLKILLVSFLIYLSVQKLITRHLIHISNYVKNIDLNTLENPLTIRRKKQTLVKNNTLDELDVLVDSINIMREKLNRSYFDLNNLNKELEDKVEIKTLLILEHTKLLEYSSRMSSLGEMAGGIAHEINNPIMIIGASSKLLRKNLQLDFPTSAKNISYLDKIDRTIDRITKIIRGLLDLSRDATNEEMTEFKFNDLLNDVLSISGEKIRTKGISLEIDLEDTTFHTKIKGRRIQISQVFLNLFHNSYDALEGASNCWIEIKCQIINNFYIIHFTDSGSGIPKNIQDKIMQPFFTTKDVGKGTGLGLSLSMTIIKSHGGEFKINNESKNTSFIISLPIG